LGFVRAIAENVRSDVRERLQRAAARASVSKFLSAMKTITNGNASAYEEELARQRRAIPRLARDWAAIECRKGCAFCCHLNVTASPIEVIHVAAALRMGLRADLESAVLAAGSTHAGLGGSARLARKLACPMLVGGACSIYQARPLACRTLVSLSARACERHFDAGGSAMESNPSLITPRVIGSAFLTGEMAAMHDLGLAGNLVELTKALTILLTEPTSLARWIQGEDIFLSG
jgi:hypothetical protein